jgi:hypothetical protein
MAEFTFCIAALLFLIWVIFLKMQIDRKNKQIAQLEAELEKRIRKETGSAVVSHEQEVWGHKPGWFKG